MFRLIPACVSDTHLLGDGVSVLDVRVGILFSSVISLEVMVSILDVRVSILRVRVSILDTFGCMYAVVGCKSMERLGACLTVGSFA